MNEERTKRSLKAIFSADVKGYSRLMGQDEVGTVSRLKEYRQVMISHIERCGGRVVDSPGDNILVEFTSVVDAVECAVDVQKELKKHNDQLPSDKKMAFRIGINLGDVIEDGDRIYGDGVNVAARIEGLAEPGGICISHTAHDAVGKKLALGYAYLGEHEVKNIEKPVRVYRVLTEPEAAGKVIGEKRFLGRVSHRMAKGVAIVIAIVFAGLISWNIYLHQTRKVEAASLDKMAFPLPDKPSIAVLAFDNLSGDPDQEYFSDGLTEEIITGLSKIPELFVIARSSSFFFKGKPVTVQQVSEALGVRYILEGSVRKQGDRVRVTAQLIDAIKGYHIWSENYDRELKDLFALQEDIMTNIMFEIEVKLTEGEQARYWADSKNKAFDLAYWQKWRLMYWYRYKGTLEGSENARKLANELIEIDSNRPDGYTELGWGQLMDILLNRSQSISASIKQAEEYAQKALLLDKSCGRAREVLGWAYLFARQYDMAIAEFEKWIALEPNGAEAQSTLGRAFLYAGRREDAIRKMEMGIRLDPYPSNWSYSFLGWAYAANITSGPKDKDLEKAIELCNKALKLNPDDGVAILVLIPIYSYQNRIKEAQAIFSDKAPNLTLKGIESGWLFKDKDSLLPMLELYRKAGIPEG